VTVFRVSLTAFGLRQGWTTASLCDEAFAHAGLTLARLPARVAEPDAAARSDATCGTPARRAERRIPAEDVGTPA
jgi:hypothetical protein